MTSRFGMRPKQTFAIADDLTGALEIAAKFAAHGLPAMVITEFQSMPEARVGVLVVDTETRHLPKYEAAACTERVATLARESSAELIYKKTDSTLRGNIAAEFRAIQHVFRAQQLYTRPLIRISSVR